jgi:hypothetical protein
MENRHFQFCSGKTSECQEVIPISRIQNPYRPEAFSWIVLSVFACKDWPCTAQSKKDESIVKRGDIPKKFHHD